MVSLMPAPEDLIGDTPQGALPINKVTKFVRALGALGEGREAAEEEDEEQAQVEISRITVAKYRNRDHLLNTHFLLLRHDCLAQMRVNVTQMKRFLDEAGGPTIPGAVRKAADRASSQRRSL